VQAGLKLLQQRQENLTNVRAKIAIGLQQAKRGELLDGVAWCEKWVSKREKFNR
jgi:hypothetical protein